MNLSDQGLDQNLNQEPGERVVKGVVGGIRVVIIYIRVF